MKKIITIALMIYISTNAYSQYQWAKQIGSPNMNSENSKVITDGTNTYLIGKYWGVLYFENDTLYSNGSNDIFIAKFDANGNELWAKTFGGNFFGPSDFEDASGVYDAFNNCIYIAGHFIYSIDFGGGITLSGGSDIFLAKMDLNGNFSWARQGGGPGDDRAYPYVNPFGKVYLVTQTSDSAYFGSYHLGPGGGIVQYDATGNVLSAELKFTSIVFSNYSYVFLNFISTDLIIYGAYKINPFHIDTAILATHGDYDGFIARADSMGNIRWIRTFGGTGADYVSSLSIDSHNNLFITGGFHDTVNIGGVTVANTGDDILIAKYNQNGNIIWARNTNCTGIGNVLGYCIITDVNGYSYITGAFAGSASFGSYNVSTTNANDMFLTRYDSSGTCLGVVHFGEGYGGSLAADNSGAVYVNGTFRNTVTIGSNNFTSYNGDDIFLTKLDEITNVQKMLSGNNNTLTIYANPNKGTCNITVPDDLLNEQNLVLNIYDSNGKLIQQQPVQVQQEKVKINIEAEATGVYNVTLGNKNKMYSGKIVFE